MANALKKGKGVWGFIEAGKKRESSTSLMGDMRKGGERFYLNM